MVTQIKKYNNMETNNATAAYSTFAAAAAGDASQRRRIDITNPKNTHPQQPSQNVGNNHAGATQPIGLIQMCCRAGCRNVATFKAGHGFCHLHQKAEALSTSTTATDYEEQRLLLCLKDQGGDEDKELKHDKKSTTIPVGFAFSSSANKVHKTCDSPSSFSNNIDKNETERDTFVLDLSDVPPQLPIPKLKKHSSSKGGKDKEKEGYVSKYSGVYFQKWSRKWRAIIYLRGKARYLGCYENEVDAAVVYARAFFKYKGQAALDKVRAEAEEECLVSSNVVGKKRTSPSTGSINSSSIVKEKKKKPRQNSGLVDLSDVPPQLPVRRNFDGSSMYMGVHFKKDSKKWAAYIGIKGKQRHIGYYDNEKDAAIDYARALFKYKGQAALERARAENQRYLDSIGRKVEEKKTRKPRQNFGPLDDVPPQPPIRNRDGKRKLGGSMYKGVQWNKVSKKWVAVISIKGTLRHIGYYDKEEDAAIDYARALFKKNRDKCLEDQDKDAHEMIVTYLAYQRTQMLQRLEMQCHNSEVS